MASWTRAIRTVLVAVAALPCGCGPTLDVEVVAARAGTIRESFREPGRTRLARDWPVAMPISGRVGRIELRPGDRVTRGQQLAEFDVVPLQTAVEEWRAAVSELERQIRINEYDNIEDAARVEADAVIEAADSALDASKEQVDAEAARHTRAAKEAERMREARKTGAVAQSVLDNAELLEETTLIELRRQQFYLTAMRAIVVAVRLGPRYINEYLGRKRLEKTVLEAQRVQMQARLRRAEHDLSLATIASPIDGVVLSRYEQGGGPLPEGHRLLLLGDPKDLEVAVEVLTRDAVALAPGTAVELEYGLRSLRGKVERIEPAGFTKLSSLGVEQQRVNVIVALEEPPSDFGVGYRVQATFITAEKADAVIVPRHSVLQDRAGVYFVFVVSGGKLSRRDVELGLRGELELEITTGLAADEGVVAIPDATLADGQAVRLRQ